MQDISAAAVTTALCFGRPIMGPTFCPDQSEAGTCGGENSVDMKGENIQPCVHMGLPEYIMYRLD